MFAQIEWVPRVTSVRGEREACDATRVMTVAMIVGELRQSEKPQMEALNDEREERGALLAIGFVSYDGNR